MDQRSCPDSWIDELDDGSGTQLKAYGDSTAVNELTTRTASLNVGAQPFIPGKNVFARAFVPSFTPADDSTATSSSKMIFYKIVCF